MSFGVDYYNQQIAAQQRAFQAQRDRLSQDPIGLSRLLSQSQSGSRFAEYYGKGRAMAEGRLPDKPKPDTIIDELQQEVDKWLENTI